MRYLGLLWLMLAAFEVLMLVNSVRVATGPSPTLWAVAVSITLTASVAWVGGVVSSRLYDFWYVKNHS